MKFMMFKSLFSYLIIFSFLLVSCNKNSLNFKNIKPQKEDPPDLISTPIVKKDTIVELPINLATGETIKIIQTLNYFEKLKGKVVKSQNSEIIGAINNCGKSAINSWNVGNIEMNNTLRKQILKGGTAYEISQGNNSYYIHSLNFFDCAPKKSIRLKIKLLKIQDENNKYYNFIMLD